MNPDEFDKWLDTRPYSKWEAFKDRNTSQVMWMRDAWEASKAEERERILNIIRTQPIPAYARSIRLSGAYLDQIIEQIRKGD